MKKKCTHSRDDDERKEFEFGGFSKALKQRERERERERERKKTKREDEEEIY